MIRRAGFKSNAALTLVAVALVGGNLLSASAEEEGTTKEKLKCDDDAIVAAVAYDGLAKGASAKEALKIFLDETYPSVDENEFEEESTDDSKPEKEKKRLTKKDKKAVAYASGEGDGFVLETFAICAELLEGGE